MYIYIRTYTESASIWDWLKRNTNKKKKHVSCQLNVDLELLEYPKTYPLWDSHMLRVRHIDHISIWPFFG